MGILQYRVLFTLFGDNQAALISIQTEITSWRSRHYGMRATQVRDCIKEEDIEVYHKKGTELTADALTKVLDKTKLEQARTRLGLTQFSNFAGSSPGLGEGLLAGGKDFVQGGV